MASRLPSEVVRAIVEALWRDVAIGRADVEASDAASDAVADAAFVNLSCASREMYAACAPSRWTSVRLASRRSMATVKTLLWRPALLEHVKALAIWIPVTSAPSCLPTYLAEDVDVLITLLGALGHLRSFAIQIDDVLEHPHMSSHPGTPASIEAAIQVAEATLQRLFVAFALVPRPRLHTLRVKSDYQRVWDANWTALPGSALGRVMMGSPELRVLELAAVSFLNPTLELQVGVRLPRLLDLDVDGIRLSAGVARQLGHCVGLQTLNIWTSIPLATAQILVAGAIEVATSALPCDGERLVWVITNAQDDAPVDRAEAERWVRRMGEDDACVEGIVASDASILIHASGSTRRQFDNRPDELPPSVIAARLRDLGYGRKLRTIHVGSDVRSADLEDICQTRDIHVYYYTCVSLPSTGRADMSQPSRQAQAVVSL